MPTPLYPKKGEKEKDYISRCVSALRKEGKSQKEAVGQCYGMFNYGRNELIKKLNK